jgi:hypothetical protein
VWRRPDRDIANLFIGLTANKVYEKDRNRNNMQIEFIGFDEHPRTCVSKGETRTSNGSVAHFKIDNESVYFTYDTNGDLNILSRLNLYSFRYADLNAPNVPSVFVNVAGPYESEAHVWNFNFFTESERNFVAKYPDKKRLFEVVKKVQQEFCRSPKWHWLASEHSF